jgi:uncharacterized protein (TIGR02284 family)
MPTTNEQVIESLNRLLAVCTRSEHGFRIAAETVADGELKSMFKQSAHQRGRLASELRMEIRQLGGEPEMLAGADLSDHRNPLCAGARQKATGVVTECGAMNRAVVTAFETALQDRNLPIELLIATRRQCDQVHETGERLATWENQATARIADCVAPTAAAISAVARRQTPGVLYEAG